MSKLGSKGTYYDNEETGVQGRQIVSKDNIPFQQKNLSESERTGLPKVKLVDSKGKVIKK